MKNGFQQNQGFSLVELMIALTIGLLILAATLSIFMSNKATYTATDNIGKVQESSRTAYEFIGRDLREATGTQLAINPLQATGTSCSFGTPVISVLNNTGVMWSNWLNTVRGFDDGVAVGGVAGVDALEIKTGGPAPFDVTMHDPVARTFTLNSTTPNDFAAGDIVMACDFWQGAVFQISGVVGNVISYTAGGAAPGNSTANLGFAGNAYAFNDHATLSRINATQWYVGANGRPGGGRSLFRNTLRTTAGVPAMATEEVAEGVRDLQITYLLNAGTVYVNATAVAAANRWNEVAAVRIAMTVEGNDLIGTNGQRLNRNIIQTINLRNRSP